MRGKITSGALMTSLVIHVVIALVAGLYLLTQTERFKDLMGIEILYPKEPPKPKVGRKFVVKPIVKPTVPRQDTIVGQIHLQPRVTTIFPRASNFQSQTVLELSVQTVKVYPPIDPKVPKVITPDPATSTTVIQGDLSMSDAPDALEFSAPIVTVPSIRTRTVFRGIAGHLKVILEHPPGLSMVENVGAARDALGDVVENITLSSYVVPPLPKGEPGGRVIGKGKDIRGILRFARVRHDLSDWWADASALNALTQWLNERTKIKTDMNVEGGAVKLNDANLFKTPLAFMTGHDPALVRSRKIFGWKHGTGRIDGRLSESEAAGMRRYLVEKGGLLVFDDCGVNAPMQAMIRLFLSQMRYVMPEYHVERISNNHEVYNNFYAMGGPPVGYDIFWWAHVPRNGTSLKASLSVRNYRLSLSVVIICARWRPSATRRGVPTIPQASTVS